MGMAGESGRTIREAFTTGCQGPEGCSQPKVAENVWGCLRYRVGWAVQVTGGGSGKRDHLSNHLSKEETVDVSTVLNHTYILEVLAHK